MQQVAGVGKSSMIQSKTQFCHIHIVGSMIVPRLSERDPSPVGHGGWKYPRTLLPDAYRLIESSAAKLTEIGWSPGIRAAVGFDHKYIVPEYMAYLMGKDGQHSHLGGIGVYQLVCWRFVARLTPV